MSRKNKVIAIVTPIVSLAICAGIIGGVATISAQKVSKLAKNSSPQFSFPTPR